MKIHKIVVILSVIIYGLLSLQYLLFFFTLLLNYIKLGGRKVTLIFPLFRLDFWPIILTIWGVALWLYIRKKEKQGEVVKFIWPIIIFSIILPGVLMVGFNILTYRLLNEDSISQEDQTEIQQKLTKQLEGITPSREEYQIYWKDKELKITGCKTCEMTVLFDGKQYKFSQNAESMTLRPDTTAYRCFRFSGDYYRNEVLAVLSAESLREAKFVPPPFDSLQIGKEPYLRKFDFDRTKECLEYNPVQ